MAHHHERRRPEDTPASGRERLYRGLLPPEFGEDASEKPQIAKKNVYLRLHDNLLKKKKVGPKYIKPGGEEGRRGKKKKELPKAYKEAFAFLGWDVDEGVAMSVPMTAAIYGVVAGIFIFIVGFIVLAMLELDDIMLYLLLLFAPVFLPLGIISYMQKYPLSAADTEKRKALTYVPEIVNYLIMQMRLQPNLERAVDFAAEHGEGKIADELKELLWKTEVGVYENMEMALDEMAYRWEPFSEEFKHAITMIRASVLIPNTTERNLLLDKVVDDVLESTKEKMELFASSMKQPSMYLFYIAVLLPLMIIIMLPVAAAFMGLPVASFPVLLALYGFALPLMTYMYAKSVLKKRPGGYTPPEIPDDYPGLPPKGTMRVGGMSMSVSATAALALIVILGVGFFIDSSVKMSPEEIEIMKKVGEKYIETRYIQYFIPTAFGACIAIYLFGNSIHKRKAQLKIIKMERDFQDVLYLLASRLGEKKPLEDAITYVKNFMPDRELVTEILDNVIRNIMVLGLTMRSAIFDPTYGALKNYPSRLMRSAFKILTDSIELGPEVASMSLISVSNQLRNVQKINELMRKLLGEVTGMMSTMATFIAPVVLGVVASLQSIIKGVLQPLVESSTTISEIPGGEALTGTASALGGGTGGLLDKAAIESLASPLEFQVVIGIYIIELVVILAYFAGKVEHGDNKTALMLSIARSVPIATLVFVVSLFLGGSIIGGLQ